MIINILLIDSNTTRSSQIIQYFNPTQGINSRKREDPGMDVVVYHSPTFRQGEEMLAAHNYDICKDIKKLPPLSFVIFEATESVEEWFTFFQRLGNIGFDRLNVLRSSLAIGDNIRDINEFTSLFMEIGVKEYIPMPPKDLRYLDSSIKSLLNQHFGKKGVYIDRREPVIINDTVNDTVTISNRRLLRFLSPEDEKSWSMINLPMIETVIDKKTKEEVVWYRGCGNSPEQRASVIGFDYQSTMEKLKLPYINDSDPTPIVQTVTSQ